MIRKPQSLSPPPSSSPADPNPFTGPMPTGENPFISPMPVHVPVTTKNPPESEDYEEKEIEKVERRFSFAPFLVTLIGIAIIGVLVYYFQDDLLSLVPLRSSEQAIETPIENPVASKMDRTETARNRIVQEIERQRAEEAEEKRKAKETQRIELERIAEERQKAEQERIAQEQERQRAEEAEEKRKAEEAQIAKKKRAVEREAAIENAVSIVEEIAGRGFGGVRDSQQLTAFTQYGNLILQDRLSAAIGEYNRRDVFDRNAIQKDIDAIRADIAAEQLEIAEKAFFAVFSYSTNNVSVFDNEKTGRFSMTIPTEFTNSEVDEMEISFPDMPDVTATVTSSSWNSSIILSVSGNTDSIKELVRNSRAYRVKVWFNNLRNTEEVRYYRGNISMWNDNSANVLKVEVFKVPTPSRRR